MIHPFFDFFNKERPFIDSDSSKWPSEWKTIRWKSYMRCSRIKLPLPEISDISLKDAIFSRSSFRDFNSKPLSLNEISSLLYFSSGLKFKSENINHSRRTYPSGGGLYPIEIYIIIFSSSDEIKEGLYHYSVFEHSLEIINENRVASLKNSFVYSWAGKSSMAIVFSFIEERVKPKYGNLAYKIVLLEAGHISQNVYLSSTALNLKCCALGGLDTESINKALGLDGMAETVFFAIVVGK